MLRHQIAVLQRQMRSPRLTWADRAFLAAVTRRLSPASRHQLSLIVTPRTLLRWHAELVRRRWTYPRRTPGRPRTSPTIRRLALEMARDNPTWGYRRIHGELTGLGYKIAPSTIWEILKSARIDPAPRAPQPPGSSTCPRRPRRSPPPTSSRSTPSFSAGSTCCSSSSTTIAASTWPASPPTDRRMDGPAGPEHLMDFGERTDGLKFLIRDRDAKYTAAFDAVFTAAGMRIITTPVQAPRANAICERWIASARRECTDRILIAGRRHLHHILSEYRSLQHPPAAPGTQPATTRRQDPQRASGRQHPHPKTRPARRPHPRVFAGRVR